MRATTNDAMGRYRSAFWTPWTIAYTSRCAPDGGVDDIALARLLANMRATTSQHACLENAKTHPGHLRTAEGRRRARDLKLLVDPNDVYYIYIYIYTPTPLRPYIYIYTHTTTHNILHNMLPTTHYPTTAL